MQERVSNEFNFKVGVGIGNYYLNKDKKYFIANYSEPKEVITDYFEKNEYSETFIYENGINIYFSYYNNELDNYKIFSTKSFFIKNEDLYLRPVNEIFKILRNLHIDLKKEYLCNEDVVNNCLYFSNIGLTIWLEDGYVSDVCIESLN